MLLHRFGARSGRVRILLLVMVAPALACVTAIGGDPAATETAAAAKVMTELAPAAEAVLPTDAPTPAATSEPELAATTPAEALATPAVDSTLEPIRAALPRYGINPDDGQLGWVHAPVTVQVTTFQDANFASDYPTVDVRNFVVHADVTWITDTGLAGCGFVFRANPETKSFYGMGLFRGGSGISAFNEWQDGASAEWERFQDAPSTNAQNGATNNLAMSAQDNQFSLYVNDQLVDTASNPNLASGAVAFAAFSESGTTTCAFSNGWLWVLP